MKITLEINDTLFGQDICNRFQDFFERLIADIADNMNNGSPALCGRYEMETATLLKRTFMVADYDGGAE